VRIEDCLRDDGHNYTIGVRRFQNTITDTMIAASCPYFKDGKDNNAEHLATTTGSDDAQDLAMACSNEWHCLLASEQCQRSSAECCTALSPL
jgi:hypothetical protein